jgi:hypothetical protein
MGKHDMPSLQMVVEGGKLIPAGPYEQEVLDTYARGAVLTVDMHQKRSLPLLKKYWAVLRDVVSNCKTPWNSPDEASDALKLALGVTDIGKTVSGQWFIRAGSISFNSMDQAAFKDFFDKAMAVLAEVTGIDPDELTARYRHIAEADHPSEAPPPGSDDSGGEGQTEAGDGLAASPSPPADDESEIEPPAGERIRSTQDGLMESEPVTGQSPVGSDSPDDRALKLECLGKFLAAATDAELTVQERRDNLEIAKDAWKGNAPDDFVKACLATADKVAKGELKKFDARLYLEGLI